MRSGGTLTGWLGRMLAGYWGAKHSPTHRHPILAGTGGTRLSIWFPLDPLSELLTIEHTGYSKGKGPVTMAT